MSTKKLIEVQNINSTGQQALNHYQQKTVDQLLTDPSKIGKVVSLVGHEGMCIESPKTYTQTGLGP